MNEDTSIKMDSSSEVRDGSHVDPTENRLHAVTTNCITNDLSVNNCVNSDKVISDQIYSESEKLKNILNNDIPKSAPPLVEQVDEDDVLADDETGGKEFDSNNIDEDELLKDTEGDCTIIVNKTENGSTFPKIFNPVDEGKQLEEKTNGKDLQTEFVNSILEADSIENSSSLNDPEKESSNKSIDDQNTVSKSDQITEDESFSKDGDDCRNTLALDDSSTNISESGVDDDRRTKFLHIDQETTQDEAMDTNELNDEDPFAQTVQDSDKVKENETKNIEDNDAGEKDCKQNKNGLIADENEDIKLDKSTEGNEEMEVDTPKPLEENTRQIESINKEDTINENKEKEKEIGEEKISDDKIPDAVQSSKDDDDDDVCIIPDTVRVPIDSAHSVQNDVSLKTIDKDVQSVNSNRSTQRRKSVFKQTPMEEEISTPDSPEVQMPSRPQRKAAKKAECQIKQQVLLDTEDGVLDEDDDVDDVDVDIEEIRYDEDDEDREGDDDVREVDDDLREVDDDVDVRKCTQCSRVKPCAINVITYGKTNYFCGENCFALFRRGGNVVKDKPPEVGLEPPPDDTLEIQDDAPIPDSETDIIHDLDNDESLPNRTSAENFARKCSECSSDITADDKTLSWETMDFCNEDCLGKYQNELGSYCANCKGAVLPASLGKYCVRFGYDIRQFCCASCLEEFKKGLKVCSFCQKDISSGAEGFLAPVGDKGQFKDFCTQACMEKYEQMSNNIPPPPQLHPCDVCNINKLVQVEVLLDTKVNQLCSEVCFAAFKFVNHLKVDKCDMCRKYFDKESTEREVFSVFYENTPHNFCCKTCVNVYILAKRKIVPCNWCKVKKYNFDMIRRVLNTGQILMMCSLNCLTLYQVSINAVSSRRIKCDNCLSVSQAQYHLTMSDATIRNFCSYPCVMNFQGQYSKSPITLHGNETQPIPTGLSVNPAALPVISSVTSLAANGAQQDSGPGSPMLQLGAKGNDAMSVLAKTLYKQQILIKPPEPVEVCNKRTQTRPNMHTKGVSCRPHPCAKETQTEDDDPDNKSRRPILIPIPIPIYVPTPMAMFSLPFPVPVPFPLPIPVPIFVPTTRNSADGILKEIKKIQEKIPSDPFEAELLMMAEMVAGEKKEAESSSEGEDVPEPVEAPEPCGGSGTEGGFSPEVMESSNTFGDDMLQMALKMASELEGPAVDLEAALTPATITQQTSATIEQTEGNDVGDDSEPATTLRNTSDTRGRKRPNSRTPQRGTGNTNSAEGGGAQKRNRRSSSGGEIPLLPPQRPTPPAQPVQSEEKPDANYRLKYTFGVNAWCQWVMSKNAELEKMSGNNRKVKLFKPEILQLTADELNYSLCLFIKEMRKPNGQEYAPDTIYYLCLGIQQYLFENGRIDNIFTDTYYEKFTDCLDEIAKKFTEIYDDRQYIVTRVEEEHLWESKQLGAHSPHVLLSTLMFFNTKHFNLTTVDEHMQLSFSHIMKHWKRNPNLATSVGGLPKVPGSRNVLLRFYPPQSALEAPNSRKKKVYEQQENEENPLRCPVKLYEFYLSKCPESVRSRSDVFYLQPERSCVPDSPVWYSTMALGQEPLSKMLHRVKMVKEINIALLST